jgi:very-short-patch-repair endonuclease
MLIKDLDGNNHNWLLTGNMAKGKVANKSSYHLNARNLITQSYPTLQILEEVPIQLRKNEVLYLDFYLPLKKICFEVHGEQHYKFIPFYHSNMLNFLKAQKRDREKQEWCELNGINYISLAYDKQDSWGDNIVNN